MGKFEGEELAEGNVPRVSVLEEGDGEDGEEVGEDEVRSEIEGRAVRDAGWAEGVIFGRWGRDAFAGAVFAIVDGDKDGAGEEAAGEEEKERHAEEGKELRGRC